MVKYITMIVLGIGCYMSMFSQRIHSSLIEKTPLVTKADSSSMPQLMMFANPDKCISQNHLDSIVEFTADDVTGEWTERNTKQTFTYHRERLKETTFNNWNQSQYKWEPLWKESIVYNDVTRTQECTHASMSNGIWRDDLLTKTVFTEENQLIERIDYERSAYGRGWKPLQKWAYSYNADGAPLKDSLMYWNEETEDWQIAQRLRYEYLYQNIHYVYTDEWNSETQEWTPRFKTWYLYDEVLWRIYGIYSYEYLNDDWKMTQRDGVGYDDDGLYKGYTTVLLNSNQDAGHTFFAEEYSYDNSYVYDELYLPYRDGFFNPDYFHHMLTIKTLKKKDITTLEDVTYAKVKYYYSDTDVETSVNEDSKSNVDAIVKVFPNPSAKNITLQTENLPQIGILTIYNRSGQKVFEKEVSMGTSIPVQHLDPGIYVYNYITKEGTAGGRLLISK